MQDGRHCPECGKDVGIWAIKFAWFSNGRVRCRHCRRDLRYQIGAWESFVPLLGYVVRVSTGRGSLCRALSLPSSNL
jgi:hypothetical protein